MNTDQKRKHAEYMRNWRSKKAEREHEMKLKFMDMMAADPEIKYYMLVMGGFGIAGIGELMRLVETGVQPDTEEEKEDVPWGRFILAAASGPSGIADLADINLKLKSGDFNATLGGIVSMGGLSISGFGLSMLFLGKIFGNKQDGSIVSSLMGLAI